MQATSDFETENSNLEGPPEEEHWQQVGLVVYLFMCIGSLYYIYQEVFYSMVIKL